MSVSNDWKNYLLQPYSKRLFSIGRLKNIILTQWRCVSESYLRLTKKSECDQVQVFKLVSTQVPRLKTKKTQLWNRPDCDCKTFQLCLSVECACGSSPEMIVKSVSRFVIGQLTQSHYLIGPNWLFSFLPKNPSNISRTSHLTVYIHASKQWGERLFNSDLG